MPLQRSTYVSTLPARNTSARIQAIPLCELCYCLARTFFYIDTMYECAARANHLLVVLEPSTTVDPFAPWAHCRLKRVPRFAEQHAMSMGHVRDSLRCLELTQGVRYPRPCFRDSWSRVCSGRPGFSTAAVPCSTVPCSTLLCPEI